MEIAELLERVQVNEFDPNAKYLITLSTEHSLMAEEHERLQRYLPELLAEILKDIPYQVLVIDNGAKLDVFKVGK